MVLPNGSWTETNTSTLSNVDPQKIACSIWAHKLHYAVQNNRPRSNFVTSGAPGASGFMWAAFFFTGKFPTISAAVEKRNMSYSYSLALLL